VLNFALLGSLLAQERNGFAPFLHVEFNAARPSAKSLLQFAWLERLATLFTSLLWHFGHVSILTSDTYQYTTSGGRSQIHHL
jgi:hypothetical protein